MLKIVVIGSGNVAQHLAHAFEKSAHAELVQAYARHSSQWAQILPKEKVTDTFENIQEADVYIIAVSDDAIAEVSALLPFNNRLVVHTSGSVALSELDSKNRRGVFYPLQTLSKNKEVDFTEVPLCLETEFVPDYSVIRQLAIAISGHVYTLNSQQRKSLHVAAVFVSNFTNHMYTIGNSICEAHNIPFEVLKPLINETAGKISTLSPIEAQTGPARRNDVDTIEKHLAFLEDQNYKAIYSLLTKSIQQADV